MTEDGPIAEQESEEELPVLIEERKIAKAKRPAKAEPKEIEETPDTLVKNQVAYAGMTPAEIKKQQQRTSWRVACIFPISSRNSHSYINIEGSLKEVHLFS